MINHSDLSMVNQQPALWPSGVDDEKEFPEGAHTKIPVLTQLIKESKLQPSEE